MNMTKVKFLYLLALFAFAWAGQGGDDRGGDDGDDHGDEGDDNEGVSEEDLYPCYNDMHCLLGEEVFKEAEECHDITNEQELELFWQWFAEEGVNECTGKTPREMLEVLCPIDEEKKKDMFDNIGSKMINYFSEVCQDDQESEDCKRVKSYLNCIGDLMDKLKKDGKCGEDVDNSNNEEE